MSHMLLFSGLQPQNVISFELKIVELSSFEVIPTEPIIDFFKLDSPEPSEDDS